MWRAVASLERLPAVSKEGLGDVALRNAVAGRGDVAFWALGRVGARVPLYGPVEEVVPRAKAEAWLDRLLGQDWSQHKGVGLAVAQLARLCGDPGRDIDERVRCGLLDPEAAPGELEARQEAAEALAAAMGGTLDDLPDLLERLLDWMGRSESPLVVPWLEDLWLEEEQVNLPGTRSSERPNWQRPMARFLEEFMADPEVAGRVRALEAARRAAGGAP